MEAKVFAANAKRPSVRWTFVWTIEIEKKKRKKEKIKSTRTDASTTNHAITFARPQVSSVPYKQTTLFTTWYCVRIYFLFSPGEF